MSTGFRKKVEIIFKRGCGNKNPTALHPETIPKYNYTIRTYVCKWLSEILNNHFFITPGLVFTDQVVLTLHSQDVVILIQFPNLGTIIVR